MNSDKLRSYKMPKILVVDDERKIRQIYGKLLALEHYEVLEAEGCAAAARLLIEDQDIQLVLLDINMPVLDGGVLYRMIRMLDAKVKVIVTSAYPLQDQRARIERADDYYDKTQGTRVLIEKVRRVLSEKPAAV